jgi:uncharacterized protein YbjT (DUF2867 family)
MTKANSLVLVLGATGKTGSRVTAGLVARGIPVRTAARAGADVRFDWADPESWAPALDGVDRVYLLAPVLRTDFAPDVADFLDHAEAAGVRHVTFLSAFGVDAMPAGVAGRAVELDLSRRDGLSHSILRPAWFMQDFSETFLQPVDGAIVVPTGDGSEAFIDADDIAAVAVQTLADPESHNGAGYPLTGPEALTVADAAAIISDVTGLTITHVDLDRDGWLAAVIASGVPAEYGGVLRQLTEAVAAGHGARPNGVVEKVTGVAPRRFAEFARDAVAAWTTDPAR